MLTKLKKSKLVQFISNPQLSFTFKFTVLKQKIEI